MRWFNPSDRHSPHLATKFESMSPRNVSWNWFSNIFYFDVICQPKKPKLKIRVGKQTAQITGLWLQPGLSCKVELEHAVLHQPTKFTIRRFRATYTWCKISISGGYPEPFYGTRWWNWRMGYIQGCDTKVADEVLGFRRYVWHEWISDRTRNLIDKKRTARLIHDMHPVADLCDQAGLADRSNSTRLEEGNYSPYLQGKGQS